MLPAFSRIASTFQPLARPEDAPFKSPLLNDIAIALPKLREPMKYILDNVNLKFAKEGKKEAMWTDPDRYPDIDAHTVVRMCALGYCLSLLKCCGVERSDY